jgi:hypothetical protein
MDLVPAELSLPTPSFRGDAPLQFLREALSRRFGPDHCPIRFLVSASSERTWRCELGLLSDWRSTGLPDPASMFEVRVRRHRNEQRFQVVFIVPTGIGADLGGHAGDAGAAARMLAATCDTLITHPNVVNASDINELPENGLYVEGSVLTRFLLGTAGLAPTRANRVLLVTDHLEERRIREMAMNSASAAVACLGMDCAGVVSLDPPLITHARRTGSGSATGVVSGLERLLAVLQRHRSEYDAVALHTTVLVPEGTYEHYFRGEAGAHVNPWGGAEAMLTHSVSTLLNVPSAHAPIAENMDVINFDYGETDPRMAAESVSKSFLHCVLKGLHRSPRIVTDPALFGRDGIISVEDVDCIVMPDGCLGLPTLAAVVQDIPVVAVRDRGNVVANDLTALPFRRDRLFVVDNYLEAAGVLCALRAGVSVPSVSRPLGRPPTLG